MTVKLVLRIAAVALFLHLLGHSYGHSTWKRATDPARQEVIKQMTENRVPFMGTVRSLADYYEGYGWVGTILLLGFSLILWILSGTAEQNRELTVKLLIPTSICLLALGVDELFFFFPFAAFFSLVAAGLTMISIVQLNKAAVS
jgi:hypothetical protein